MVPYGGEGKDSELPERVMRKGKRRTIASHPERQAYKRPADPKLGNPPDQDILN